MKASQEITARLREIVAAIECGDEAAAERSLDQLVRERESGLFSSLGRVTRELHKAVQDIRFDGQLSQLARADMPDAVSRLDYVMQVTERAAHRTLDLVESSRSLTQRLESAAQALSAQPEAQKEITDCAQALRANLSELAQAQEYQDVSGQIIRRVIQLVRSVESALLDLLRASGSSFAAPVAAQAPALAGPAVSGLDKANNQQDADALLAELGF